MQFPWTSKRIRLVSVSSILLKMARVKIKSSFRFTGKLLEYGEKRNRKFPKPQNVYMHSNIFILWTYFNIFLSHFKKSFSDAIFMSASSNLRFFYFYENNAMNLVRTYIFANFTLNLLGTKIKTCKYIANDTSWKHTFSIYPTTAYFHWGLLKTDPYTCTVNEEMVGYSKSVQ